MYLNFRVPPEMVYKFIVTLVIVVIELGRFLYLFMCVLKESLKLLSE